MHGHQATWRAWGMLTHNALLVLVAGVQASDFPGSDAEQVAAAKQFTTKAAGYGETYRDKCAPCVTLS